MEAKDGCGQKWGSLTLELPCGAALVLPSSPGSPLTHLLVCSLSFQVLLHPWDKPAYGCWNQQSAWIHQAVWAGDITRDGPFTLGLLMS